MNKIKKIIWFLSIILMIILIINSCSSPIKKIEKYINNNCNFKISDTCNIDIQKALGVEYDTMYIFSALNPLSGVQRIIGIPDYRNSKNPERLLDGTYPDTYYIILIKKNKVVYENKYYPSQNLIFLFSDNFIEVKKMGIFDGDSCEASGYMNIYPIFKVVKKEDNSYILE